MDVSTINVLVVDDEQHVCCLIKDILARDHFRCTSVHSGEEAEQLLLKKKFDVTIIDLLMPGVSGMDLLNFISSRNLPTQVICITGASTNQYARDVLAAGAFDFLEKPLDLSRLIESVRLAAESRVGINDNECASAPVNDYSADEREGFPARPAWADSDEQLKQMLLESAGALVRTVEAKDPYTRRHSDHVAYYAKQLARHVGASKEAIESIRIAALLHDVGKIAVPDSVLVKPGKLSRAEFALVRRHPDVGAEILKTITMLRAEARLVLYHHESWDGGGYPTGLVGEKIPLGSRILNIADSIDAMLMHRTYKRAYPVDHMLEELDRCAGGQFDPDLARQAGRWCRNNPSKLVLPKKTTRKKTA